MMPDLRSSSSSTSTTHRHLRETEDEVPTLPPFCSPRPIPVSRDISELDLTTLNISAPRHIHNHAVSQFESPDSPGSYNGLSESLPGLVSPAFTPPSTPGASTPSLEHRPPKSVPVDSTSSSGGCGSKKPKLLKELPTVRCEVRARIPLTTGTEMFLHVYSNSEDKKDHLAIVFGDDIRSKSLDAPREGETEYDRLQRGAYTGKLYPGRTTSGMLGQATAPTKCAGDPAAKGKAGDEKQSPLVRIHSECYTGETVWSARCDCGEQLDEAARLMSLPVSASNPTSGGVIIYLRQEGRGIGLGEKLKAYNLQDMGADTVEANLLLRHPADARSYGLATAMLLDLGVENIRLLTNNPDKVRAVEGPNREVVVKERVAMIPLAWRSSVGGIRSKEVDQYLKTKIEKMAHMIAPDVQ